MLDVDGIVNTDRSATVASAYDDQACPGFRIPDRGDPIGARLINRVCETTGAKLVICSTWLYTVGPAYTVDWLLRTGIDSDHFHVDSTVLFRPGLPKADGDPRLAETAS